MSNQPSTGTRVFDPKSARVFSLLPPEDEDEAYCVRHDEEMTAVPVVLEQDGAIYGVAEGFTAFICPSCLREMAIQVQRRPKSIWNQQVKQAFDRWDRGEAEGEWFEYRREVEDEGGSDDG